MSNTEKSKADVPYMERTRNFYRAQGYTKDYVWAQHDESPFQRLSKPLNESRVTIITTSMPDTQSGRNQRQVYTCSSEPIPESMYTEELSWHKSMTHTDDVASFLPLAQLRACAEAGRIGSLSGSFHTVPTEYSQRNTIENDAPNILTRCIEDEVDVAILVPL